MSLLEEEFRQLVMAAVAERTAANGGVISRAELSALPLANGETRRVIDTSKGIWNPRDLVATLSIVSSSTGPYDDRHVDGGLQTSPAQSGTKATTGSARALILSDIGT